MILGVDVSYWQGLMDWQIAREAGVKFAFIRAGSCNSVSGVCYEDFLFKENAEDAPKLMPVGYYWYLRPQHNSLTQANYFCDLLDTADYLLPPVCDVENSGGLHPSAYADAVKNFLDRVETRTGYKPIIYTSKSKWAQVEPRPYWDDYDLWVAHYTMSPEPLVPEAWDINGWMFWQYTSQGDAVKYGGPGPPSGDDDIDLNWFNGTEDEFLLYLGAEPPMPKRVRVKHWKGAVLRDIPRGEAVTIAKLDEELRVIDSGVDGAGKEWYQVASGLWLPVWSVEGI